MTEEEFEMTVDLFASIDVSELTDKQLQVYYDCVRGWKADALTEKRLRNGDKD